MKVYINDQLYDTIQNIEMLRNVIADLKIDSKKEQKILQIMIDGKHVETLLPGQTAETINEVVISLKSSEELIIESLIDGLQYCPILLSGITDSIRCFREWNLGQGISVFEQSIDGINWIHHVLAGLDIYILSKDSFEAFRTTFHESFAGFGQILQELLSAWENEDFVLVSDLLEYELVPMLEMCQTFFPQILDQLAGV